MKFQEITPEKFEESPILFGDFIKIGATESDKKYEEFVDVTKLETVLSGVRTSSVTHIHTSSLLQHGNQCGY